MTDGKSALRSVDIRKDKFMIDRACISINNRCNLACKYCHFHEKKAVIKECDMDIRVILDNIRDYIQKYSIPVFKIGFVGNGEPFLDFDIFKLGVIHISDLLDEGRIKVYTITNGTCVNEEILSFCKEHNVDVGFSIDGPKSIHDGYRCDSFDDVMRSIELFRSIFGHYPSMNCTVGKEALADPNRIVDFFKPFGNRITFSRMIGKLGISLPDFRLFIEKVQTELNVRTGGYDCTMYGGMCGAGINNIFYANNRIYICGNCIDLESLPYETPLDQVKFSVKKFDRHNCYKESIGL